MGRATKIFNKLPEEWTKHKVSIGIQLPAKYNEYLEQIVRYTEGADSVQDLIKMVLLDKHPVFVNSEMRREYLSGLRAEFNKIQEEKEGIFDDNEDVEETHQSLNGKASAGRGKLSSDDVEPLEE